MKTWQIKYVLLFVILSMHTGMDCILGMGMSLLKSIEVTSYPILDKTNRDIDIPQGIICDAIKIKRDYVLTDVDIEEESKWDDMELLAQLTQAEAGNQDLKGKQLVVDVVLNRVDSPLFPDTVEEVIFQNNQFSVIKDGGFDRAGYNISDETYEAVKMEMENRINDGILYFGRAPSNGKNHFKYGDHYFGY